MMGYTDRHFRWLLRRLSKRTQLWSEMIVASTLYHRQEPLYRRRLLAFDPAEHPLIAQLGGDEEQVLAEAARICEDFGYDGINLNVGCPSPRVQQGRFGAVLMLEPDRVASLLEAMRQAVRIPVSIKHRLGVDEHDDEDFLFSFVQRLARLGTAEFVVHARKAWLQGLSPAQNRSLPPLCHQRVYSLKAAFPHLTIVLNGGVGSLAEASTHLERVDGVMIGRAVASDPLLLQQADSLLFGEADPAPDIAELLAEAQEYLARLVAQGEKPAALLRHLIPLFRGWPSARRWRAHLAEAIQQGGLPSLPEIYRSTLGCAPDLPLIPDGAREVRMRRQVAGQNPQGFHSISPQWRVPAPLGG
jgi:tRNA-dihydrouridine synthase A